MSKTDDIKSLSSDIESSVDDIRDMLSEAIEECYREKVPDSIVDALIKAKKELSEIDKDLGRIGDYCDDLEDEIEEMTEAEEERLTNHFEGIETIYWQAANFRDKEMMESLSECIDRKIPVPKIINVLSAL